MTRWLLANRDWLAVVALVAGLLIAILQAGLR